MYYYRVTKYDPALRDADGAFHSDDWTSISDIGHSFNGVALSESEYLRTEDGYVKAVLEMMEKGGVDSFCITGLSRSRLPERADSEDGVLEACISVRTNEIVTGLRLEQLVRGCLREYIWCRLVGRGGAYVHFGYDYYMYVGLPVSMSRYDPPSGIFVEEFDSPYFEEA
jgi:hypothetical protein